MTKTPKLSKKSQKVIDRQMENWRTSVIRATAPFGSKTDIAEKAGRHPVFLARLANGEQEPSLRTALALSLATGTPIENML